MVYSCERRINFTTSKVKTAGANAFAKGDSSASPSLLSQKLGPANFSDSGNGIMDIKFDCTLKSGSDEYLNLAKGQKLHPADRLTCHFEGQRQCLSNERWLISSILYPMKL